MEKPAMNKPKKQQKPIPPFNDQEFLKGPWLKEAFQAHEENSLDLRVARLLKAELEGRLGKGEPEEMLDKPEFKEKHPEYRAALLNKLKELGRVSQDKE
jgi:hypothetical protein